MDKHRKALELAGHAGCILLKNGAEIFRVQETMTRILCAYGVTDNNVYVISNGIFATAGEGTEHALSAGKRAERSPLSSVTNPLPQIYGMKPERRFWAANR